MDEADSPTKSDHKEPSGATAYNTTYDSKWCSKYQVKAWSSQTNFSCVVCFREFSCAHQGEADVKRHILTTTHKDKASSLRKQQNKFLTLFHKAIHWLFKFSGQKFPWPIHCWKQFFDCYNWQMWHIVKKYVPRFANCKTVSMCEDYSQFAITRVIVLESSYLFLTEGMYISGYIT